MEEQKHIWTRWDWRKDPDAPFRWVEPDNMVVLVEDWVGSDPVLGLGPVHPSARAATAAWRHVSGVGPVFETVTGPTLVTVETRETLEAFAKLRPCLGNRLIPAMRIERQADLAVDRLAPLMRLTSRHRALVITPREEIDLDPATCGSCGNREASYDTDGDGNLTDGTPFCAEHEEEMAYGTILDPCASRKQSGINLVIVDGPTGPDAWPMHPAWLRAMRDTCKDCLVAFSFIGWGTWGLRDPRHDGDVIRLGEHGRDTSDLANCTDDMGEEVYVQRIGEEHTGRLLDDVEHLALPSEED